MAAFQRTTEPLMKFVPFTVRVKAAPPTVALEGDSDVTVGTGLLTGKSKVFEIPPPGAGFSTLTGIVPAAEMSKARMAAVTCVLFTKVVVRVAPENRTTEPLTKFVPFTVRVKAAAPRRALEGDNDVRVGAGLLMVKLSELEVPPPGAGLKTVTATGTTLAMSAAVMVAANCVLLP